MEEKKILMIELKSYFKKAPIISAQRYSVAQEDETSYTLVLPPNAVEAGAQIVQKADLNEVRYIQVFSQVDSRTYWHFHIYVYAEVDKKGLDENFIDYWTEEIKKRAMNELKDQNIMLKDMYKHIEGNVVRS